MNDSGDFPMRGRGRKAGPLVHLRKLRTVGQLVPLSSELSLSHSKTHHMIT